ncbi:MAG TPA: hypothetical protein VIK91_20980 [Nannocystis sp.]
MEAFVRASAILTGFDSFELFGTGLAAAHYRFVAGMVGDGCLDEFVACVLALPPTEREREREIRARVLADDRFGPVARSIIKLWYLGTWYALPAEWHRRYGGSDRDVTTIPSREAYVEGLVWGLIGAHPQGAKPQGYGAWAKPPRASEPLVQIHHRPSK